MKNLDDTVDDTTSSSSDEITEGDQQTTGESQDTQSRSAEGRINELLSKNKELEEKMGKLEESLASPPPPPPPSPSGEMTPEVQRAVEHLKKLGFVSKEDLESRVRMVEDRATLNTEHVRLSNSYDGSDGRPKYDKGRVETYMREHGVYDPGIAYEAMHKSELLDWEIRQAEEKRKTKPYTEKQGTAVATHEETAITREKVAESMKTPEGREWYEKNRKKILSLMAQGQL